ncbi:NAD(P)H-dependent flavin oxidoreductase [Neobacillus sp. NRS-1170]|uniref:NAD(P)H-dependent flavin oxidoreductase n=1 Tax=Neobacillus sp. NRS-1170 TaxID=3233898 RepID=UPI003D2D7810
MSKRIPQHIAEQLELPVITAPMFLVSGPEMIISACKAGVISAFPSLNARTVDDLEKWMHRINNGIAELKSNEPNRRIAPWAMAIVLGHLSGANSERVKAELELIKKCKPPIVITALGDPAEVVQAVHSYGGLVFSDVTTLKHARKASKSGVDGLILVCAGAGGHAGTLNSFAFVKAVREFWDGVLILSGGISSGNEILAAQTLDVDLVYMGTRFIASSESMASEEFKNMLVESTIEDLVYTPFFTGIPATFLKPSIQREGFDPDNLGPREDFLKSGKKAWKNVWSAGQGVGRTKQIQTVAEIVAELKKEYNQSIDTNKRRGMIRSVN